jgi:hypothetical protein
MPFPIGEHPLLMTARAEVTGLARVGQQVILSTPIAVDARKTMVQVAAAHEAFEHLALDRPVDEPGRVEFVAVSAKKLIERTRPRIAWAVDATSW